MPCMVVDVPVAVTMTSGRPDTTRPHGRRDRAVVTRPYNFPMSPVTEATPWGGLPGEPLPAGQREAHVAECSPFVASLLERHPDWREDLDSRVPPSAGERDRIIAAHGLESGLRRYRNHQMARIIWRDLCGLADLDETFADLTVLAEQCLDAALDAHFTRLAEKHGEPVGDDGTPQRLSVIGLGKFGGGELNLSSDIDIMFCTPGGGETTGGNGRPLASDQFFIRQARSVIASLSDVTEDGFCFRVDTRLRPFGDASPLTTSLAALEQYYQREGRDWERYALIKARPVAGDRALGAELMQLVRPFVYRRYIDFSAVEALQEMHASVREDARRRDRLDDIKRGPGGIREIEFLAQCFQILRGGREPTLQTPSLAGALDAIGDLGLLEPDLLHALRTDYVYLRQLENRIQAQRDQQLHRLPSGDDLQRLAQAMGCAAVGPLEARIAEVRNRVQHNFQGIFPAQPAASADSVWVDRWRALHVERQASDSDATTPVVGSDAEPAATTPLDAFLGALGRLALSQRADRRLNQFMPLLLERLNGRTLDEPTLHRIYDLVLAICRRSAYLLLLTQNPAALDRLINLFGRSAWVADRVTRFPALLDELIDPSLGLHIPGEDELDQSVARLLQAAQGAESVLEGLNYLRLANTLRIAVGLLRGALDGESAQSALAALAGAILRGVLTLATDELEQRHGPVASASGHGAADRAGHSLAIIAYGSLGSYEPGFDSDLDIVFLFDGADPPSAGKRSLPAERWYARLAQRILSFLTAMTPSGRLYAVDTRLRPNGRAGSLVSSLEAFGEYQRKEAWTWELQALTRARAIAGQPSTGAAFEDIRRDVLTRPREPAPLRQELADMRERIEQEHGEGETAGARAKQQRGGLIDIEFVIQLGVLEQASRHPGVLRSTASLRQLEALVECGWISGDDAQRLGDAARALRRSRMLQSIDAAGDAGEGLAEAETQAVRAVYERLLGPSAEQA